MHWYLEVLKKYAVFGGRARRKEFWLYTLFNMLICFVLLAMVSLTGGVMNAANGAVAPNPVGTLIAVIYGLYCLATLIPSIAVAVRRLHDAGYSAWFLLLVFIPFIGGIILIVLDCLDSQPGTNRYGPNPKEVTSTGQFATA